jgi:hypothetical protein
VLLIRVSGVMVCRTAVSSAGSRCGGVDEHSVPQASLVSIRQAPRIVQPASQAMMTQMA